MKKNVDETYTLERITDPETEPVTVAEAKLHARISHDTEDATITGWIKSARILAEDFQRRSYIEQTWNVYFNGFPKTPITLHRGPLIVVLTISYWNYLNVETVLSNSDFIIANGKIALAYGEVWPTTVLRPFDSVKISYITGYGDAATDVPETVKDAITLYCGWRNEHRGESDAEVPQQFYDTLQSKRLFGVMG